MENAIELKSVTKVYKSKGVEDVVALDDLTLSAVSPAPANRPCST